MIQHVHVQVVARPKQHPGGRAVALDKLGQLCGHQGVTCRHFQVKRDRLGAVLVFEEPVDHRLVVGVETPDTGAVCAEGKGGSDGTDKPSHVSVTGAKHLRDEFDGQGLSGDGEQLEQGKKKVSSLVIGLVRLQRLDHAYKVSLIHVIKAVGKSRFQLGESERSSSSDADLHDVGSVDELALALGHEDVHSGIQIPLANLVSQLLLDILFQILYMVRVRVLDLDGVVNLQRIHDVLVGPTVDEDLDPDREQMQRPYEDVYHQSALLIGQLVQRVDDDH